MRLQFKLLKKNVNFWQLIGFALANLCGAVVVLLGIQAYRDASVLFTSDDGVLNKSVMVLSKPEITAEDLAMLSDVPSVVEAVPFRTSDFPVYGSVMIGGFEASTEMFVESVPDCFLDVDEEEWTADIDDEHVPIIIPRAYINFYNYGFAAARGTPQLGQSQLSRLPVTLTFRGMTSRRYYRGYIVGFTDQVNTILVPDDFLRAANDMFAYGCRTTYSRVILETDGSDVRQLMRFVEKNGYVIDGAGEESMKLLSVVRTIISIVIAIGLLVSSLSFFLLFISIVLLMEKNRYHNDVLHQLGYPQRRIALPYQILTLIVDGLIWLVAFAVTALCSPLISRTVSVLNPDFHSSGLWTAALSAFLMAIFFSILHAVLIGMKVKRKS